MNILGINSVYHELAAALLVNGKIVAAAEEERFNRYKHGKAARVDNPHQLPEQAIEFCLNSAGLKPQGIDAVCYSFSPQMRRRRFRQDKLSKRGDWGDAAGEEIFISCLEKVPAVTSELLGRDITDCFHWIPHHLAHAASAFYPSGAKQAAILVLDGIGEQASMIMASGEGHRIRWLRELEYPHSLGFLWEKLSKFLGFTEYDACKVMGLASYGNPNEARRDFESFLHLNGGSFKINPEIMEFRLDSFQQLERCLGKARDQREKIEPRHANIAATLQDYNDRIVLSLTAELYELCPAEVLCFAGGVALNCTTNWLVKEKGPFRQVYIPPAPHDAGTAIGAALYTYWQMIKGEAAPTPAMEDAFLGPQYTDEEMVATIKAAGFKAEHSDNLADEVAELIAGGKIVGWFQNRMEFGPRALGNRSLLTDPRHLGIRETLNRKVKHREDFRPFAPSVLEEDCEEWFEMGRPSESYAYMLFACPVKADKAPLISAVLHVDKTARVQVVRKKQNPKYHALISRFKAITGVPLLLNTSFNDSEPIVCSPQDALATFKGTDIDVLVLGNNIMRRSA